MPRNHLRILLLAIAPALAITIAATRAASSFTIVLIPDTQNYTGTQGGGATPDQAYSKVTGWIKAQAAARNIVVAIHLGDITNSNGNGSNAYQWNVADDAHDSLDAIGMAYSVVPGNHDHAETVANSILSRSTTQYASRFGPSRFNLRPWYLPTHPFDDENSANNAVVFQGGDWRYVVVSLDFAPTKNAVCWAADLISQMKDHRVIIATHSYLRMGQLLADGTTRTQAYAGNAANYNIVGMDGIDLWNELGSLHSNIEMMVSGHIQGGAMYAPRPSSLGNTVHQILVDYQAEVRSGRKHGQGWIKLLEVTPSTGAVRATVESALGATAFNAPDLSTDVCGSAPCYMKDRNHWDHTFNFAVPTELPADEHRKATAFTDQTVNIASKRDQRRSKVAIAASGDFIAVWEDDSDGAENVYEIMGRRFASDGCGAAKEFHINVTAARQQLRPDVAVDANGSSVTVWEDDSHGAEGVYQIYARGISSTGAEVIPTFTVNQVATNNQLRPRVARAPAGAFAVAWRDERSAPSKVYVRGLKADGSDGFNERRVNSASTVAEDAPAIAIEDDGDVVVAWEAAGKVFATGFDQLGAVRFAPIQLASTLGGWTGRPAVAAIPGGGFVAAWEECVHTVPLTSEATACSGRPRRVVARVFQTDGAASPTGEVLASAPNVFRPAYPQIAAASDGRFMVVWQDDSNDNNAFEIVRRSFNADGTAVGAAPETVNKNDRGNQLTPAIAVRTTSDGTVRWVVTWTDDLDRNGATQILARGGVF